MNATHIRVTITATATGGTSFYDFTDAADTAEAERRAMAEATVDYGFLNVGLKVDSVSVWNFETRSWDAVAEDDAAELKALDEMTDDEKNDEIRGMWAGSNGGQVPYFGFFGGGPASDESKRYLRHLLTVNRGRREAELIRWMLNRQITDGETISRLDVLPALKILKAL